MPVSRESPHVSRDERRRRTEQAILEAAREAFATDGYERTTIRAVASSAGVDPALVMQYFGSKEGLFAEAARWPEDTSTAVTAPRDELAVAALRDVLERFEGAGADREAAVALMRSCLTHPEATRIVRDEVMCDRMAAMARTIGGDDGDLRAGLLVACVMGLSMSRHVLGVEPVASASREDLERLLEPALRALVQGAGADEG
ncbi:MAG TPA: TetR family transcriptional regulator [Mycobacteriales bacterium]|nr:TetR family transcriptional regulator [Mycobacteriales bacterium]